jgi:hypothetical protein
MVVSLVPVLSRVALAVGTVLVASCGMSNAATREESSAVACQEHHGCVAYSSRCYDTSVVSVLAHACIYMYYNQHCWNGCLLVCGWSPYDQAAVVQRCNSVLCPVVVAYVGSQVSLSNCMAASPSSRGAPEQLHGG